MQSSPERDNLGAIKYQQRAYSDRYQAEDPAAASRSEGVWGALQWLGYACTRSSFEWTLH